MSGNRTILNSILTILAIILLATAACLTWLPSLISTPPSEAQVDSLPETDITPDIAHSIPVTPEEYANSSDSLESHAPGGSDIISSGTIEKEKGTVSDRQAPVTKTVRINSVSPRQMLANHPFKEEAIKVLSGKLNVADSARRCQILNYCEHFRMAYDTKDIDFLRQVFSDDALIIVGHTVRSNKNAPSHIHGNEKVSYTLHTRKSYIDKLSTIFESNQHIKVNFTDFHIMRHPSVEGLYGVTLHQKYESDKYSDEGYVFLLWDFRNESMPLIHVRTWQPESALGPDEEPIGMTDFNLD